MSTQDSKQRRTVKLGSTGPEVFPLALGGFAMSGSYGPSDDAESIRTLHAAIERGVTLIDTGDFYGMGHNEMLIGQAIQGRRDQVLLSVKFGSLRGPDGSWTGSDSRPVAVKNFIAYSLKRLGVEVIDIYRPSRLDPTVPIEDTIGTIADLVKAGYVRHIGLSEVGVETIRRAHKVHPIVDLQIEYSLASRGPEAEIFPVLQELGISATLYGVLSRGLLTGSRSKGTGDFRAGLPRFNGAEGQKNEEVVRAFQRFAQERGMSPGQLAFAWVLARQPTFVPILGARTRVQLEDLLGCLERPLSEKDLASLEALVNISGERYPVGLMARLDSERRP